MTSAHQPLAPDAPIGVFDSGVGGLDVAAELTLSLPHERLIYLGDGARVPYGTRTPEEVKRFTEEALITLLKLGVKAVVLACNTASAWALDELSQRYHVPIFGMIEAGVTATESVARALPGDPVSSKRKGISPPGTDAVACHTPFFTGWNATGADFCPPSPPVQPASRTAAAKIKDEIV